MFTYTYIYAYTYTRMYTNTLTHIYIQIYTHTTRCAFSACDTPAISVPTCVHKHLHGCMYLDQEMDFVYLRRHPPFLSLFFFSCRLSHELHLNVNVISTNQSTFISKYFYTHSVSKFLSQHILKQHPSPSTPHTHCTHKPHLQCTAFRGHVWRANVLVVERLPLVRTLHSLFRPSPT